LKINYDGPYGNSGFHRAHLYNDNVMITSLNDDDAVSHLPHTRHAFSQRTLTLFKRAEHATMGHVLQAMMTDMSMFRLATTNHRAPVSVTVFRGFKLNVSRTWLVCSKRVRSSGCSSIVRRTECDPLADAAKSSVFLLTGPGLTILPRPSLALGRLGWQSSYTIS
jgi:hypothetical protein